MKRDWPGKPGWRVDRENKRPINSNISSGSARRSNLATDTGMAASAAEAWVYPDLSRRIISMMSRAHPKPKHCCHTSRGGLPNIIRVRPALSVLRSLENQCRQHLSYDAPAKRPPARRARALAGRTEGSHLGTAGWLLPFARPLPFPRPWRVRQPPSAFPSRAAAPSLMQKKGGHQRPQMWGLWRRALHLASAR